MEQRFTSLASMNIRGGLNVPSRGVIHFINFLILFSLNDAAFYSVYWTSAIKLSTYNGYRSMSLLSYNIPSQTEQATFTFQSKTSGNSCKFKEVYVYFQYGTYPLVTPFNETYPPNFYTNRSHDVQVMMQQDAPAVSYVMSSPTPGFWYIAAFLPKSLDRIQQKGFSDSCLFGMVVVVEFQGKDNIEELSIAQDHHIHLKQDANFSALYRFVLPQDTVDLSVSISNCSVQYLNDSQSSNSSSVSSLLSSSNCAVIARIQAEMLPSLKTINVMSCSNQTECMLNIKSPNLDKWTYISFISDEYYNVSEIMFVLHFDIKGCKSLNKVLLKTLFQHSYMQKQYETYSMTISQDACIKMNGLSRFIFNDQTFNISYVFADWGPVPSPFDVHVPDHKVLITSFRVESSTDIGGTMKIYSRIINQHLFKSTLNYVIHICLMKKAIPGGQTIRSCDGGVKIFLNASSEHSNVTYIPYPESGTWNLGLNSQCYNDTTKDFVNCIAFPEVSIQMGISGCVDGRCGEYGACENYISGVHIFSSCKCFAGWRGYGCTDGTEGRSKQEELTATLLLTLSNLMFIPAVCVSIKKRLWVEGAVYFYTMFFSSFYHACDTSELVYYCLFRFDVLSFADFLGSICSFWVTLLAMAHLPSRVRSFAHVIGALGVAIGVEYDRHGIWVFAVPAGLAAAIMFGSWIFQCRRHKKLHPPRRYYLFHLLPGLLLAVTGLVLFAFLETEDNYKYTHSGWHMAMSLSIVFLLPVKAIKGIRTRKMPDTNIEFNTNATNSNSYRLTFDSSSNSASNGEITKERYIDTGDNPAYIPPCKDLPHQ